jgi:hypothetical protein
VNDELRRWLHKQAAREQRIVLLEEALLGDRLWRYSWYRLRYFFVSYLVSSASHAVTVLLLFKALQWENFLLVVVVHAGTALVGSFWWGALEAMRAQVRELHRSGKPHRIAERIAGWLVLAGLLSAAVLAIGSGWIVWQAVAQGSLGAADAYVATLFLRLGLELATRAYHSGVYALRRVYKPLPATVAPELATLAVTLALWPVVEGWAVPIASVVATALVTGLSIHYTRRVYRFLGLAPLALASRRALRTSLRGAGREALSGGAAHAVMALDSLAVLALLYGAGEDSESLVVLFLSGPTIRAGSDWARLLYFDLKRLELRLFTNLRRRFERHTFALSWVLGLVFAVCAAAISTAFYGRTLGSLYVALLAFFLARSQLARAQIQAFADGAYAALFGTGVACLAGLAAVGPLADGETERMAGVAVVTALSAAVLLRIRGSARARGDPGAALLPLEWLARLGQMREEVRVGSARVLSAGGPERLDTRTREDRNRWRLTQLSERAARRLGAAGAASWIGPDRLVWFERPSEQPRLGTGWLTAASGGLVGDARRHDCREGEHALFVAGTAGMLGHASTHLHTAIFPVDVAEARRTFLELVPGGVVYAPEEPVLPQLAVLPGRELRAILFDAATFARDLRVSRRRSSYDVTALCAGGELKYVFVADLHAGRKPRGRWRHFVLDLNVRAAIGGVTRESPRGAPGRLETWLARPT